MVPDRHTVEGTARRGRELYDRKIRSKVEDVNAGKFLVVDVDSGEYEMAEEDTEAFDRALAKNPEAILYGIRVGEPAAYRLGSSRSTVGVTACR